MKTAFTLIALTAFSLVGCSGALRDAKMWQDDTAKVFSSKNEEIKACYDGILKATPGVPGKVTINFEVETEIGKVQNVVVDKANSSGPPELGDCVKKSVDGLVITPVDAKVGKGTWVYEFSQPPAPKS